MSKVTSEKGSNNDSIKSPNSPSFIGDNELIGKETDDFICKSGKEVLKAPNCTYTNEVKIHLNINYVPLPQVRKILT